MKKNKKMYVILGAVIAALTVTALASGEDPVISLSYLNDIFMPKVESKIKENAVFTVVNVPKGSTFSAGEGCELILRGGEALVKASENGGISDVTDGVDLAEATTVPANHHLIVPRNDGRGIVAKTDVILMVKGSYELQ